jgi:hypothetical protein
VHAAVELGFVDLAAGEAVLEDFFRVERGVAPFERRLSAIVRPRDRDADDAEPTDEPDDDEDGFDCLSDRTNVTGARG